MKSIFFALLLFPVFAQSQSIIPIDSTGIVEWSSLIKQRDSLINLQDSVSSHIGYEELIWLDFKIHQYENGQWLEILDTPTGYESYTLQNRRKIGYTPAPINFVEYMDQRVKMVMKNLRKLK